MRQMYDRMHRLFGPGMNSILNAETGHIDATEYTKRIKASKAAELGTTPSDFITIGKYTINMTDPTSAAIGFMS